LPWYVIIAISIKALTDSYNRVVNRGMIDPSTGVAASSAHQFAMSGVGSNMIVDHKVNIIIYQLKQLGYTRSKSSYGFSCIIHIK
jgi:hypothetical protein